MTQSLTSHAPDGFGRWLAVTAASAAAACLLALSPAAQAQPETAAPRARTESPYFFVKSDDPALDRLPLKATEVDVRVSGVIADVTVTQHYRNEGTRAIEARYVFPGSTRAAVYGMNVRLADRLITAQIREKQQARVEYDQAKSQGRTAALLEQHLPNVFQMNVANILPGDDVKVELRYTELLVPQDGRYQFVFPTVAGPRYNSPQSSLARAAHVAQPYLPAGEMSNSQFDIQVSLMSPIGAQDIRSSTHAVEVTEHGHQRQSVSLRRAGGMENDRDYILDWRLAGDRVESGAMLYRGPQGENYFLAMVEPPRQVSAERVSPREYIFVVDISGSMHGFPLDVSKAMLRQLIGSLKPGDRFNVLLFAGSNSFLAPQSVPATPANIEHAIHTISRQGGGGSTELIPALRRVYAEPKAADVSRTIVVVTDGYVTVEREAFELVRRNLSQANVFAFGIGSAVNRHLIEGLARAGMGEPFVITRAQDAPREAERFRRMIESPVLTSVTARFEGFDAYDVEPRELPDVLAARPVIVFGKWRGQARGHIVLEGQSASGPYRQSIPVGAEVREDASALRYLWARHRIAALSDQEALEGGDAYRDRITALGLQFGLLTPYTSFLAIDKVVRATEPGAAATVNQPSPMPQGVSNLAVGAEVPGTPEPETWGAMLLTLSLLAMLARRRRRARADRFTA